MVDRSDLDASEKHREELESSTKMGPSTEVADGDLVELRKKALRKIIAVGLILGLLLMSLGFFAGRALREEKDRANAVAESCFVAVVLEN